ncbi:MULTISPECIES: hypothetical protein [unclassified Haladaptatus]|uniref:hypothetical protein n=1 Tax=unclassified Haladaptatus TaxID=2622732 RepID=UPI00209BE4D2|nr:MULTISPECIES: hypothetical protein [unclassified Haladaptatus]MCO8246333.1 hypothetical protein [Haladaptatus sp. AB643]MCO8255236.1 hypothetical protein [Haladaptatus sp. AB618]
MSWVTAAQLATAAQIATAVNMVLLAVLGGVWARNYMRLRSKHTLGMLVFASLLFCENGSALYYYLLDPDLSIWFSTAVPPIAWHAMLLFHVLEMLAIGFLAWVTLD